MMKSKKLCHLQRPFKIKWWPIKIWLTSHKTALSASSDITRSTNYSSFSLSMFWTLGKWPTLSASFVYLESRRYWEDQCEISSLAPTSMCRVSPTKTRTKGNSSKQGQRSAKKNSRRNNSKRRGSSSIQRRQRRWNILVTMWENDIGRRSISKSGTIWRLTFARWREKRRQTRKRGKSERWAFWFWTNTSQFNLNFQFHLIKEYIIIY